MSRDYSRSLLGVVAGVTLLGASGFAQAATVTFSNIVDGNSDPLLFDVSTTRPDPNDGNVLLIGMNDFTANGASSATVSAVDTLTMTITAPRGFRITSVDYTEAGNGNTTSGVASASGSLVADGQPTNFLTQLFAPNTSSGWTITPTTTTIAGKSEISVSITNSLFAFAFALDPVAPLDTARITKTAASLSVGITAIPLPASVWMLGAALVSLLIGRRRSPRRTDS